MDQHPLITDPLPDVPPTEPPKPGELKPVSEGERILTLDVLRGFALFGIFMVNMQFFAMPFMRAIFDPAMAEAPAGDVFAWAFIKLFFEYKFVSLFSLMFGIGLAIQLARAQKARRPFYPPYLRRLGALAIIGLVHGLFIWYGDILFFYAGVGLLLLLVVHLRPKTLIIIAACVFSFGVVLTTAIAAAQIVALEMYEARQTALEQRAEAAQHTGAEQTGDETGETASIGEQAEEDAEELPPLRGWDAIMDAQWDPASEFWIEAETLAYKEGPLGDAMLFRAISYAYAFIFGALGFFWHIFALFLVGAALIKLDFFAPHRRLWHVRCATIGLAVGLSLEGLVVFLMHASGHEYGWYLVASVPLHEFGSILTALGYVGAICLLVSSGALGAFATALAAVGRMALTNYILQSLVATFIMYWWGLALFGDVPRPQQVILVVGIFLGQIVLSVIWLRFFTMGPLEALWRTATYGRFPAILRASDS